MIEAAGNRLSILMVDDTPTNLAVLCEILTESGFELRVAEDGLSALEQMDHACPDLILLDVLMPGINGFETCRRLKERPDTRDIPVIFMTALTDTVDKLKGFELGAVDYITKPLQHEEVLTRVAKYGKKIETVPDAMVTQIKAYPWPGNVRELQHVAARRMSTRSTSPGAGQRAAPPWFAAWPKWRRAFGR